MADLIGVADLGPDPTATLRANLNACQEAVGKAARRCGRLPESVLLLPVTKYADVEVIRLLADLGVRDFAENRVQAALAKVEAVADIENARFHFIGHLQRNKVRRAVEAFRSFHALDSERLALEIESRLADHPEHAFEIWVEVNISGEQSKTGLPESRLLDLLRRIDRSDTLRPRLRGLMGMAPYDPDPERARPSFRRLREWRDRAVAERLLPPTAGLSMGMSGDFEVAIEEGATVVRVGSALFEPEGSPG